MAPKAYGLSDTVARAEAQHVKELVEAIAKALVDNPSRLSAARISNREYCCVTPWLLSSLDHES
jgi:hypothetical protein